MDKMNILITAIGGDLGYSLYKILKNQNFVNEIFCCDMTNKNASSLLCKNFFCIPPASDDNYYQELETAVKKYKIQLIIPSSEYELRFFLKNRITHINSAPILMASEHALTVGLNKYYTYEFLKNNNLPYPKTYLPNKVNEILFNFPVILKHPESCGSNNIILVENQEELNFYTKKFPEYIVQEYIKGDEYTCGLYRNKSQIETIIFRRNLKNGVTHYAELITDNEISQLLINLAKKLDLSGSINIQLRKNKNGIFIFEINPRFSSTTIFRHQLGFTDLLWSIYDIFHIDHNNYFPLNKNAIFYRIYDEVIKIV